MELQASPPLPLTRPQQLLTGLTALAVALTRLMACSKTLWDWDEVQFALAVVEYDAAGHRPHPPGFPLFIALANMTRVITASDFRALQVVTVIAAMTLFPLFFFLCRELGFSFPVAWSGSLLAVFLPNVWFYGGTGFSDIPSLALTLAACAFLLRGARERGSLFAGAVLLGLAAAIRPQALLIGAAPALIAVWKQRRRRATVLGAMALGAATVAAFYAGAILASSSYDEYMATARKLREYLRSVDSFLSPTRPPLEVLFEFFFLRSIPGEIYARVIIYAAAAGAIIASIRRDGRVWLLILIFLPFQIFAWLMLDFHSVSRYGVTYAPMYAILAAAALAGTFAWIPGVGRWAGPLAVLLLTGAMVRWSMPALAEVRRNPSPPVRALEWIDKEIQRSAPVFVHGSLMPFATFFIGDRPTILVDQPQDLGPNVQPADAILVTETPTPLMSATRFVRERGRVFDIVRQRYFETTILPANAWAKFGDGWHPEEWHGADVWLWMGARSVTLLPPSNGATKLTLRLEPALEKGPPILDIRLNGTLVETIAVRAPMERTWTVDAAGDRWNELVLTSDRFVNPLGEGIGSDSRDLSVRLLGYDWKPAAP